jgi:hypothetical protein
MDDSRRLEIEATQIYRSIFGGPIPPVLRERFVQVAVRLHEDVSREELKGYYRVIDRCQNLEALEFASRLGGRLPLLTRKFQAMVYLAETLPDHQDFFVNRRSSFLAGLGSLAWGTMWSVWQAIRGFWLLRMGGDD